MRGADLTSGPICQDCGNPSLDVVEGREKLNFSDWLDGRREGEKAGEIRKEIEEGEMPPFQYRLAHPEARLSGEEKQLLIKGLTATVNAK